MSHLGRPEGNGFEPAESLRPARAARRASAAPWASSNDCTDQAAADAVAALQPGDALLLENLRFHKGEKKGDAAFAAKIAAYGEIYVNDAFGTCHRPDASMVAVPRTMPAGAPRVVGYLVEKEIRYLSDALADPARPFVVVLGGAKVSDKLPAIENLLPKADAILIGGAMAYTFLKALGKKVGASRVEDDKVSIAKSLIEQSARTRHELHLPIDHVCSTIFAESAGNIETFEDQIKDGFMGLDIGPKTVGRFGEVLRKARTILWNGPMGVAEWRPFRVGTESVARSIARATEAGAVSIVGGGDSAAAVERFGLSDRMTHVSTGGGASLEMLEGKRFESVDLLDEK